MLNQLESAPEIESIDDSNFKGQNFGTPLHVNLEDLMLVSITSSDTKPKEIQIEQVISGQ